MSATRRRGSSAGGRKKKALAEVPERAPVAKKKMAAFFDPGGDSKSDAPEKSDTGAKSILPETEKHLKRVAVKVQVSTMPAEPKSEKPAPGAGFSPAESSQVVETSPAAVGRQDIRQDNKNENNLVKGGKVMSEQEQMVQQTESGGGSNLIGFVALFVAIAALALVWFYASTATGSPSVLSNLQKSKVSLAQKIDALDAKVDALEAKMVAADKEKLAKSVNSSIEVLDKLAANADPKTAAMLKKMKAEMEKMVTEVK